MHIQGLQCAIVTGAWQPVLCRFDEHPTSQSSGFVSGGQQNKAGQAQADSMGTGGFLNPPPGQTYDEANTTPDITMRGEPGTIKGANLGAAGAVCLLWRTLTAMEMSFAGSALLAV